MDVVCLMVSISELYTFTVNMCYSNNTLSHLSNMIYTVADLYCVATYILKGPQKFDSLTCCRPGSEMPISLFFQVFKLVHNARNYENALIMSMHSDILTSMYLPI